MNNICLIEVSNEMEKCSYECVGPIMYEYTLWVLEEACRRNIKKLFFLARDGYLLYKIADEICKKKKLDIECRYLYCSRRSLRLPSFHLIGDEMYDLLFIKSQYMTPKTILQRADFDDAECDMICCELGVANIDQCLDNQQFFEFTSKLRNKKFKEMVDEKSIIAYEKAIGYFKQEGLLNLDYVAIVDSGWTGSMQRSLRQILEGGGYRGKIYGFYFGLFEHPNDPMDGEYLSFYFSPNSGTKRKVMFNNNLFECMLSADHGMTLRYEMVGDKYCPVLCSGHSEIMSTLIRSQIIGALRYTGEMLDKGELSDPYDVRISINRCYNIIKKYMVFPSLKTVELYSHFIFCDDITESYHFSLVDESQRKKLSNYLFVPRLFKKIFHLNTCNSTDLIWPYGTASFCSKPVRNWYCINIMCWDWLRYLLK